MSFGAYFATQPSSRTYVDTSQSLSGFGASEGGSDLLAIYDGVAGLGNAGGCGCAGARGKLSGFRGFGNEVLPDGSTDPIAPIASSLNLKTALVAMLVVGSLVAVGAFLLGPKPMRANGRKRRMKRNGRRKMRRNGTGYAWRDMTYQSALLPLDGGASRGNVMKEDGGWEASVSPVSGRGGDWSIGVFSSRAAAKAAVNKELGSPKVRTARRGGRLSRNGAPAYLLTKKGKTTKRQAKAAGHYLAETRWHGGPKRTARWSGKHLAHKRFNTNGRAMPYGGHASVSAYHRALRNDLVLVAQDDAMKVRGTMKAVFREEQEKRGHALSRTQKRAIAHELASADAHSRGVSKPAERKVYMNTFLRTVIGPSAKRRAKTRYLAMATKKKAKKSVRLRLHPSSGHGQTVCLQAERGQGEAGIRSGLSQLEKPPRHTQGHLSPVGRHRGARERRGQRWPLLESHREVAP